MKISTRLPIKFSFITSAILAAFALSVYYFASTHREEEFQKRLNERVLITEKLFLERESFSPVELEKVKDKFLHTLPEETEEVVEIISGKKIIFKHLYPPELREKIFNSDVLQFGLGQAEGHSTKFQLEGGNYIVIVTANDESGLEHLMFLKYRLIILILLGIPLIFIGSFMFTSRALRPIVKKIDHANKINASSLHERLKVLNSEDEIGKMAIAFNSLLDRLEISFNTQKSFISNASHEMRNPLTTIIGEAEIAMSKTRTPEEYWESLKIILSESERLNLTISNLLTMSRVMSNDGYIKFESIHFVDFIKEVKESYDYINADNNIEIKFALMDRFDPFIVWGNRNLLKTAVVNLFDNACKFSSNNSVKVALSNNEKWCSLMIKDKGIGISEKDITEVGNIFYRGENAIAIKGSGIGFSLSSKIVKLHKGKLELESRINQGTEVVLKLPVLN